jgi:hypothetical protein
MKPLNKTFRCEIQFVSKARLSRGIGGGESAVALSPSGSKLFHVKVAHHQKESRMQDFLAHELGHVVQEIFRTDAAKNDPRIRRLSRVERRRIVRAEEEAWVFGKKIRPQVNTLRTLRAVESYREGGAV